MAPTTSLNLATLDQISSELSCRQNEEFILIYRDRDSDEWIIDLNDRMDGLQVVTLLNSYQSRMLQLMRDQQHEAIEAMS
jgi:hypothetical protein